MAVRAPIVHQLLILPAAVLFAVPGCREAVEGSADPAWLSLEVERVKLRNQVDLLKLKQSMSRTAEVEFSRANAGLDADVARQALLSERLGDLRGELAEQQARFESERAGWIATARASAVGRSFDDFSGAGGRSWQDVVITRVTDIGVEFRHSTGTARIGAADLTSAQQGLFGIDAERAGEASERELARSVAYENWVDEKLAMAAARDEAEREAAPAALPPPPPVTLAATEAPTRSRLRDEPREVGPRYLNGYSSRYPRYRYYHPYTGYHCTTYRVRQSFPNIRVASSNWSYTPRRGSCNSPVVTPRRTTFPFTSP